jgi:hypothetical protein
MQLESIIPDFEITDSGHSCSACNKDVAFVLTASVRHDSVYLCEMCYGSWRWMMRLTEQKTVNKNLSHEAFQDLKQIVLDYYLSICNDVFVPRTQENTSENTSETSILSV